MLIHNCRQTFLEMAEPIAVDPQNKQRAIIKEHSDNNETP